MHKGLVACFHRGGIGQNGGPYTAARPDRDVDFKNIIDKDNVGINFLG